MRLAKAVFALMFVLVTVTAGAAPRDDDPRQSGPIDRVVKFLRHVLPPPQGGEGPLPTPHNPSPRQVLQRPQHGMRHSRRSKRLYEIFAPFASSLSLVILDEKLSKVESDERGRQEHALPQKFFAYRRKLACRVNDAFLLHGELRHGPDDAISVRAGAQRIENRQRMREVGKRYTSLSKASSAMP